MWKLLYKSVASVLYWFYYIYYHYDHMPYHIMTYWFIILIDKAAKNIEIAIKKAQSVKQKAVLSSTNSLLRNTQQIEKNSKLDPKLKHNPKTKSELVSTSNFTNKNKAKLKIKIDKKSNIPK